MKKIPYFLYVTIAVSLFTFQNIYADVLELKNGSVLNGTYKGGTQGTLRFQVDGEVKVIPSQDIMALTFTGGNTANSVSSTQQSAKQQTAKSVAKGTLLLVRTTKEIGTHNLSEGERFSVKLENKLVAGKTEVAPVGATIYGRVLKSTKGGIGARKAILELTLTDIMIDGVLRPIKTSVLKGEGQSGGLARKVIKGAAVGALANGNTGADDGARIGASIGILGGGKHAGIQSGSVLEFVLTEPLKI